MIAAHTPAPLFADPAAEPGGADAGHDRPTPPPAARDLHAAADVAPGGAARYNPLPGYPGAKEAPGVCEAVCRILPPHLIYVELCLGSGSVLRRKRPALYTLAVEINPDVCERWRAVNWPGVQIIEGDALDFAEQIAPAYGPEVCVYADPPYPRGTRSARRLFAHEWTDEKHARFVQALDALRCSVVVSTYDNPIYRERLGLWNLERVPTMTRGGPRTELIYHRPADAPASALSIDAKHIGRDKYERDRLKKKRRRWTSKFRAMPQGERALILSALLDEFQTTIDPTRPHAAPPLP